MLLCVAHFFIFVKIIAILVAVLLDVFVRKLEQLNMDGEIIVNNNIRLLKEVGVFD